MVYSVVIPSRGPLDGVVCQQETPEKDLHTTSKDLHPGENRPALIDKDLRKAFLSATTLQPSLDESVTGSFPIRSAF
jgi:hypothetical protein